MLIQTIALAALLLTSCNGELNDCFCTDNSWLKTPKGQSFIWRKEAMPLKVYPTAGVEPWNQAAAEAIEYWNDVLGCQVLYFVSTTAPVDTPFMYGFVPMNIVAGDESPYARVRYSLELSATGAGLIGLPTMPFGAVDPRDMTKIVIHELGHLLGLAHDDCFDSIMHPTYYPANRANLLATPADIERLQLQYCPADPS